MKITAATSAIKLRNALVTDHGATAHRASTMGSSTKWNDYATAEASLSLADADKLKADAIAAGWVWVTTFLLDAARRDGCGVLKHPTNERVSIHFGWRRKGIRGVTCYGPKTAAPSTLPYYD